MQTRKSHIVIALSAACLYSASSEVFGQEANADSAPRRAWTITPRVSISETFTNNVGLTNTGQQSEQITEISPGVQISVDSARLKAYLDYSLVEVFYAQTSSPRQSQNSLNSFGTFEAVENWAFVDFGGIISRRAVSAFGSQAVNNVSLSSNQSEVSSYSLAPYVRGRLGESVSYEARYGRAVTSSDAALVSDVTTDDGSFKVKGGSAFRSLGWSGDLTRQSVDYSFGRSTESDRINLGLSYSISSQVDVFVNLGREANNYTTFSKENYSTGGLGIVWSPSEATRLSAFGDHRSFGNAHSVSLDHRTARTAWKYSDTKDVAATPNQEAFGSLGSVYDLLFAQFATIQPDLILRAQLVNAYLQANGISPNANVSGSFLTSALSLQRRQDLSFALLGVRDTITFFASRSKTSRLDTLSTAFDDFTTSQIVRQRGFSVNYAHRLSPDYSLGALLSQQHTLGSLNSQDTTLRTILINVVAKVGRQSSASVGLRRTVSGGTGSTYSETAVTANLNARF